MALTVKDLIKHLKDYNEDDLVIIGDAENDYESILRLTYTEPVRIKNSEIIFDASIEYNAVYLGTECE